MKSEDWIDFREQKPAQGQDILACYPTGIVSRFTYDGLAELFTHWQPWAAPPVAMPFEAWWESLHGYVPEVHRKLCEDCWNAGAKWATGQRKAKE